MPELPEVETVIQALRAERVIGRKILFTKVFFGTLDPDPLINEEILEIERRGKYIIFTLSNWQVVIHLRMSGKLFIKSTHEIRQVHEHIVFTLDNGQDIRFYDPRKFGTCVLVKEAQELLQNLGKEALKIPFLWFFEKLMEKKRGIKSLLLDQSFIAGLGNIYVDEALWHAQIHPQTRSSHLLKKDVVNLQKSITFVLEKALAVKGTSLGQGLANFQSVNGERGEHQFHLDVYGRQSLPCKRCQIPILKIKVAQRGTHFCPACQLIL